jgi:hypothetical protein
MILFEKKLTQRRQDAENAERRKEVKRMARDLHVALEPIKNFPEQKETI